jgi:hypothetical protein
MRLFLSGLASDAFFSVAIQGSKSSASSCVFALCNSPYNEFSSSSKASLQYVLAFLLLA